MTQVGRCGGIGNLAGLRTKQPAGQDSKLTRQKHIHTQLRRMLVRNDSTFYGKILLLFGIMTTIVGCATQFKGGFEAVSPKPSIGSEWGGNGELVSSLQPTLKWKSTSGNAEMVDVVVYEAKHEPMKNLLGMTMSYLYTPGHRVYYRESIRETEHTLEDPLKPGTIYVWSVRSRDGTKAGPWATYDYQKFNIATIQSGKNLWWQFTTRKQ